MVRVMVRVRVRGRVRVRVRRGRCGSKAQINAGRPLP